ncbi:MAG: metal-dependent phosphohydrolase [Desulfobacterales bacterium]|nr:MAG: metal-dependent phosphohydrolase [Desulfobacterales bacterium]
MLAALIPAAGLSSRMGQYKPLLPLGDATMIGTVIGRFQQAGIQEILVVTGHNHHHLAPAVEAAGARPLFNPDYALGMFSSIRTGVAGLPKGIAGFFLLPADIPAIRTATILRIQEKFEENKTAVIIPTFKGETGHPPLIPARLISAITDADLCSNLRQILFSNGVDIHKQPVQLPVYDQGILMDADTPKGYAQVKEKYASLDVPNEAECQAIIDDELTDMPHIKAHVQKVSDIALILARALNQKGTTLNTRLIQAGALLHDIKRTEKHHAQAGGRWIRNLGFPNVADIVGAHMDLVPGTELDAVQLVYFADKLCQGDRLCLNYPDRFYQKARQVPHAKKKILRRLEIAQRIHAKIESVAGQSLRMIFGQHSL